MKKRSLFAAVAMLIVSALVLTSATYAWFNVGGDATIKATRGSVMQAGTGIRLKTDNGMDWNSTLLPQYFTYSGSNSSFVQHWTATWDSTANAGAGDYVYTQPASETAAGSTAFYAPMSAEPQANYSNLTFYMYDIKGDNSFGLSQNNSTSNLYRDEYEFHIGTLLEETYGSDVEATFKLYGPYDGASATAAAAARALVYLSYDNGSNYIAWNGTNEYDASAASKQSYDSSVDPFVYTGGAESNPYDAVASAIDVTTNKIYDDSGTTVKNYIMNSTDTGYSDNSGCFTSIPTTQMKNASGNGQKILIKGVPDINSSQVMIRVVVWIEGQDSNCAPALGGGTLSTEWAFTYKNATAAPTP
ncbi:MAG: hypothetical protein IKW76_09995 [Clostridia bacterium]|nr:hypothetical protein [Clostridia bacterium]